MPHEQVPESLRKNAKRMRKAMTEAERKLWSRLRAHRLAGLGFKRQVPIGKYIADFACAEFRLVVEADGTHHAVPDKALRDRIRTRKLGETGWTVIRFWNIEILKDIDGVCDHIAIWIDTVKMKKNVKAHPPLSAGPTSPPQGGRKAQVSKLTGGCQCGAIRFAVTGPLEDTSICHCRMCQKAFGNFYAPLVSTRGSDFRWTRGEPKRWRSSNHVQRGFCENCGTPLTYEADDGLAVAIGAFDHPELLPPKVQYGSEAKIAYVDDLKKLPSRTTMDDIESAPFLATIKNFQHPDEDVGEWPVVPGAKP